MAASDDYLRHTRTIVLGAGFSAAGGIPLTADLLPRALRRFRIECNGIFSRIEGHAMDCFANSASIEDQKLDGYGFAELCSYLHFIELNEHAGGERWSDAGSRELLALRYYLSKEIAAATPAPESTPLLYKEFAKQLRPSDWVLTFNWDCLLEQAIEAVGRRYTYCREGTHPFDPAFSDTICITKMHGSINWMFESNSFMPSPAWIEVLDAPPINTAKLYSNAEFINFSSWRTHKGPLRDLQPFIVLPGHGKSYDVRRLSGLWYRSEGYFYVSRDTFIIGLSLSEDDYFIRFFMQRGLPISNWNQMDRKVVVINPNSEQVAKNYRFLSPDSTLYFPKCFDLDDVGMIQSFSNR
jgi:hypothetical protein